MGTRVGLTGATGVLGRRLAKALGETGAQVVPFGDDLRDEAAARRWVGEVETVVHAAAMVPVDTVNRKPADAIAVNVGGTASLAVAAAEAGLPFTYISTSHVYAPQGRPIAEDDITAPVSAYGLTKLQGEAWVRELIDDPLVIRVFSFFDAEQKPPYLVPSLRERILAAPRDAVLSLHGADSVRDIADAGWMARICAALIGRGARGVINCGTGRGHTVAEIARSLAESLDRADVTWQAEPGGSNRLVADTTRLASVLGDDLPAADLAQQLALMAGTPA